jgi:hypothetical protein
LRDPLNVIDLMKMSMALRRERHVVDVDSDERARLVARADQARAQYAEHRDELVDEMGDEGTDNGVRGRYAARLVAALDADADVRASARELVEREERD